MKKKYHLPIVFFCQIFGIFGLAGPFAWFGNLPFAAIAIVLYIICCVLLWRYFRGREWPRRAVGLTMSVYIGMLAATAQPETIVWKVLTGLYFFPLMVIIAELGTKYGKASKSTL